MQALNPNHLATLAAGVQSAQQALTTAAEEERTAATNLNAANAAMTEMLDKVRTDFGKTVKALHDLHTDAVSTLVSAQQELTSAKSVVDAYIATTQAPAPEQAAAPSVLAAPPVVPDAAVHEPAAAAPTPEVK